MRRARSAENTPTGGEMTVRRGRWKLVGALALLALAATALILSLTACSSSGSGDSETAASDPEQAALDFAQCMRENGVPNFPDPVARPDGSFRLERPPGVSADALDDALKSCESEAQALGIDSDPEGGGADAQDALLRLSRCMRANGLPEIPDPKPRSDALGGLHDLFRDYDLESPRVATALNACQPVLNQLLEPVHGGGG
jgi:hypothetical protein